MNEYGEMFYGTLPPDTQDFRQVLSGIGRTIRERAAATGQRFVESAREARALQDQAFGDPTNPLRITDERALARLTDMIMGGPLGFAPAGITSIVRGENPIQSAAILIGNKIFTGQTHSQALDRAVYEGAVRKEGGKFIYPKDTEINMDLFLTKDGRIIDRLDAFKMFDIGASETAIEKGIMQTNPASSITVDDYIKEAEKIKSLLND
jgi:hypothetical protein